MHKILKSIVAALMMLALGAGAAEQGTADEAVAMVKKAAEFLKKNGREKAFAEFNNPKGQFIHKDFISLPLWPTATASSWPTAPT